MAEIGRSKTPKRGTASRIAASTTVARPKPLANLAFPLGHADGEQLADSPMTAFRAATFMVV